MQNGTASAVSPSFYIPESTNITVAVDSYAYKGWGGSYSPMISFAASKTPTQGKTQYSVSTRNDYPATASFGYYSENIEFNNTISQVCIHTTGSRSGGVDGFVASVVIKNIYIKYKE